MAGAIGYLSDNYRPHLLRTNLWVNWWALVRRQNTNTWKAISDGCMDVRGTRTIPIHVLPSKGCRLTEKDPGLVNWLLSTNLPLKNLDTFVSVRTALKYNYLKGYLGSVYGYERHQNYPHSRASKWRLKLAEINWKISWTSNWLLSTNLQQLQ